MINDFVCNKREEKKGPVCLAGIFRLVIRSQRVSTGLAKVSLSYKKSRNSDVTFSLFNATTVLKVKLFRPTGFHQSF